MQKDKKQGLITELHPNGKVKSKTNYKNNQRHGLCSEWYESGHKKFEWCWKDGKRHGVATYWVADPTFQRAYKRQSVNYKYGAHHGLNSEWYESGQKQHEVNYKDGLKHGTNSWWDENGQKVSAGYYVLDEKYACIFFSKEGNVTKTEIPTLPHPTASPDKTNHKIQKIRVKHAKP